APDRHLDVHGDPEAGGIPARRLAARANRPDQSADLPERGRRNHDVVGQAHGHADFPRSRDRDRQRRPSGEKVAEGSGVLLRAFHAVAREAGLEAPSRRGIEGPRHRRQHRRGPERRLQHRPQPGPRRVERPEDEGRPRVEPGSAVRRRPMVGDPERVDPRAVAHPRHLAQPARRVSRVENQAETGEPARGRDGWPESAHAVGSTPTWRTCAARRAEASRPAGAPATLSLPLAADLTEAVVGEGGSEDLLAALLEALRRNDAGALRAIAALAVQRFGGLDVQRDGSVQYYLYR